MIDHFDQMGVVEVQPGLPGDPDFPDIMQVSDQKQPEAWRDANIETEPAAVDDSLCEHLGSGVTAQNAPTSTRGPADLTGIEKVHRFPNGPANVRTS